MDIVDDWTGSLEMAEDGTGSFDIADDWTGSLGIKEGWLEQVDHSAFPVCRCFRVGYNPASNSEGREEVLSLGIGFRRGGPLNVFATA